MKQLKMQIYNKKGEPAIARIGDLFFIQRPISMFNSNEIMGYLPIISLLTAIRQEDGRMWFYTLAMDDGAYSVVEMGKDSITVVHRSGKDKIFTKASLVRVLIDKFHDRNTTSLTVSKSPMYTTRIVTSNLEISHSNFVYLSYRMADISLWPIRAIHMWAKYHMRVEGPPIPKIFENIEMRIEAVQTVVYGHTIGKLEKQHRKKKSKKNALGIAYDGSVGVPPPPSRDDPDRIFRTDGVTHLRIHESEMQQVGKVMFRGPVHIDEVPYYSVLIVDGTASYITVRPEDIAEHITSMYFTDGTVRCGLIQYTPENCSNVKTKIRGVHAQQRINENFDPLIMRTEDSPGEERTLGTNHPASPRTLGTNHPASPWSTTLTRPLYVTQAGLAGLANSTPEATYGSASVAAEETVDVQEFGSVGVGVPTRNPRNYGEHYRRMTEHSRVGDGERHSGRHWDSPALSEEMQRVERELREQRIADAIAQEEDSEELNVEQE